mmetsp:Transcript_63435/g.112779  ORF Transcript_63435/g.112779 Transcript_63435/m.112779 type:complete len:95 (+) Transcript_63435:163-447(+)
MISPWATWKISRHVAIRTDLLATSSASRWQFTNIKVTSTAMRAATAERERALPRRSAEKAFEAKKQRLRTKFESHLGDGIAERRSKLMPCSSAP